VLVLNDPPIGAVNLDGGLSNIVVADIPGLIEGAHDNRGRGVLESKHSTRIEPPPPPPPPYVPRVCMSIHPVGKSCSDLGRVFVLNDFPARTRSQLSAAHRAVLCFPVCRGPQRGTGGHARRPALGGSRYPEAGGGLRTRTRLTLNRRTQSTRMYPILVECMFSMTTCGLCVISKVYQGDQLSTKSPLIHDPHERAELEAYLPRLSKRPALVVGTKSDISGSKRSADYLRRKTDLPVVTVCGIFGGVQGGALQVDPGLTAG